MKLPDFQFIMDNCVKAMLRHYKQKQDSWETTSDEWFVNRIAKQLENFPEGHIGHDLVEKRKRLTNIINYAAMMYHNIGIENE